MDVAYALKSPIAQILSAWAIGFRHQFDEGLLSVRREQSYAAERRHALKTRHKARIDTGCLKLPKRKFPIAIVANATKDSHGRSKARKSYRYVAGHPSRRTSQQRAVHFSVPRRKAVDLDHHIHIDVAYAEEQRRAPPLGRCAHVSARSAPVM